MPAKVKVRILAGRNLPVMDKSSDASDAFVEVKLGNTTYKTEVYRRSLNPFWNSEWFRFEVSDQELQDEPLQIRIMDYDTYSANDAIGKVYINLNPLLVNPGRSMSGWLPIYDTLHGIRGEINCMVKVNLFADNNRYRHSSCGVRFFFSDIPNGYKCDAILGFVDELLVNDDPEYQWIDKIRTPRASNEARQTLFTKLSGEVQRKLGLKAEIFGGNAVVGYQQSFDLEGGSGIVGRGIGTAVVLSKIGFPYEGIISPMHICNAPYPYLINNSLLSNHDRSNSFIIHKNPTSHPDRHLVHSVSADYFYEVPTTGVPSKKLSVTLESNNKLHRALAKNKVVSGGDDDDSEYEDCEEMFHQQQLKYNLVNDDDDDDDNDDDDDCSNSEFGSGPEGKLANAKDNALKSVSPPCNSIQKSKRLANMNNKSSAQIDSSDLKESRQRTSSNASKRKLSATFLLDKLRQSNENMSQKLASVTRPIAITSGLTKLLPFRRHQNQVPSFANNQQQEQRSIDTPDVRIERDQNSTNEGGQNVAGSTIIIGGPTSSTSLDNHSSSLSKEAPSSQLLPRLQSSSEASAAGVSEEQQTVASSSGSHNNNNNKRRREKSQSIDDALSIIEEKFDDDDHLLQIGTGDPAARPRLLSGSSGSRYGRPMVRSKEIDEDRESEDYSRSKGLSISSADDEDDFTVNVNASATSLSTSATLDDATIKSPQNSAALHHSESLPSSSSPSASISTDATIKLAVKGSSSTATSKPVLITQQSSPASQRPHSVVAPTIRRSDTELAQSASRQSVDMISSSSKTGEALAADKPSRSASSHMVNSDSKRSSPDLRQQSSSLKQQATTTSNSSSFAQSVRVVKARQHLLQNMIKQQNQHLLVSSTNRAKNAFMYPNRVQQSEYPFVTLKRYPDNMIKCTGGVVSVHSVKLLDHIINDEESETRDIWWTEIRKEIRSHAKALNCDTILGYSETSRVLGDVCVLSACGTAAILKPTEHQHQDALLDEMTRMNTSAGRAHYFNQHAAASQHLQTLKVPRLSASPPPSHSSMPAAAASTTNSSCTQAGGLGEQNCEGSQTAAIQAAEQVQLNHHHQRESPTEINGICNPIDCSFCHTPLFCVESINSLPNCTICQSSKVPDVLLLTIEPPQNLNIASTGTLVQARVCRAKRDSHGEASAKEIGDALPFLEYELHRQLFSKLKFKGMNCLFNLSIDISVGENMLTGIATGTGCFVLGLPTPEPPQISAGKGIKTSKLNEIQRLIALRAVRNRDNLGLCQIELQLALYHEQLRIGAAAASVVAAGSTADEPHKGVRGGLQHGGDSSGSNVSHPDGADRSNKRGVGEASHWSGGDGNSPVMPSRAMRDSSPDFSNMPAGDSSTSGHRKPLTRPRAATTSEYYHHTGRRHNSNVGSGGHYHNSHQHRHHQQQQPQQHHRHHNRHHNRTRSPVMPHATGGRHSPLAPAENLINLLSDEGNIVLEVDDNEDADIIALLIDSDTPDGYLICNSESIPTVHQSSITSINMFTQVLRVKLSGMDQFAQQFDWILQALFVKLRRSLPCCLSNVSFVVDLPESHVVQISVTGCLLSLRPLQLIGAETCADGVGSAVGMANGGGGLVLDPEAAATSTGGGGGGGNEKGGRPLVSTSTSTVSPSSVSSSSSSSSSPTSSSASSSDSSASMKSVKEVLTVAPPSMAVANPTSASTSSKAATELKSLTKQLSKTNIAALLSAGKSSSVGSDKKKSAAGGGPTTTTTTKEDETELVERPKAADATEATTTKATIAAVKQEIQQNRLGGGGVSVQQPTTPAATSTISYSIRPVFKKQQTYPGALSPSISGHDKLLPNSGACDNSTGGTGNTNAGASAGSNAARRATIILNKVMKQPLKDIGSNFNSSAASGNGGNEQQQPPMQMSVSPSGIVNGNGTAATKGATKTTITGVSGSRASASKAHSMTQATGTTGPSTATSSFVTGGSQHDQSAMATAATSAATVAGGGVGQAVSSAQKSAATTPAASTGHHHHHHQHHHHDRTMNSSIDITSLSYIPGAKEYHYLGNLSFSFVRETSSVRENGGLNGFIHCFLMEVYAIVRAHVSALGGNAFLSFRLQQSCIFYHSNKNQAQCLISVAGDAVQVTL